MLTPEIQLFQQLASETWYRLKSAHELSFSFSEETITDLNLLEIKKNNLPKISIKKSNKRSEGKKGFDWEFWIGRDDLKWRRYSIQAKKLYPDTNSYKSLRHRVRGKFQIDRLKEFSRINRTTPLYCFYNYPTLPHLNTFWTCKLKYVKEHLGCTVIPLHIVEKYHQAYQSKKFEILHKYPEAKPWHCLFCPHLLGGQFDKHTLFPSYPLFFEPLEWDPIIYDKLPDFLRTSDEVNHKIELNSEYYINEKAYFPRWVVVIETSELST